MGAVPWVSATSMTQVVNTTSKTFTLEEYLRFEETAEGKHEFRNGEIIDMSGGSFNHALISMNIGGELRMKLKGSPCGVLSSDLRVRIAGTTRYCYPDVSVCGLTIFDPPSCDHTVTNPKLLVEVLSPSTEASDRGEKFHRYLQIESLEEYVLVSQAEPRIDAFFRHSDGSWVLNFAQGLETTFHFRSLGIDLPLSEVYAGVVFPTVEEVKDANGSTK